MQGRYIIAIVLCYFNGSVQVMLESLTKIVLRQIFSQAIVKLKNKRNTPNIKPFCAKSLAPEHMASRMEEAEIQGETTWDEQGGGQDMACSLRFRKGIHSSSFPGSRSEISYPQ